LIRFNIFFSRGRKGKKKEILIHMKRMNWFSLLTLTFFTLIGVQTESVAENYPFSNYRWKNRVLIVFAPDTGNPFFRRQISEITSHQAGVAERDMVVIQVIGDHRAEVNGKSDSIFKVAAIRDGYGVNKKQFRTILVGKDGGEKLRSSEFIPMAEIFSTIDAMPMRQSEMRERSVGQ
jgi:hypothetical protein